MWGGKMALWKKKRRLQGGSWHLRESCLTLGRLCCPQRTKQVCLSPQLEQASPAQAAVIYHVAGNSLLLCSQAPRNPFPLSAVASLSSRCQVPTSQQGSSLAPSKEAEPGGATAIESKGWDPGPVRKSWRSHCHRL